jgi:hypothetical protein
MLSENCCIGVITLLFYDILLMIIILFEVKYYISILINIIELMEKSKYVQKDQTSGVVDFEDVKKIHKKNVRGLLRKRAKKYECTVIMQ